MGHMAHNLLLRSAPHDRRPWDGFLARLRVPSVDRQLATRRQPGSARALAIRARRILSLAGRRKLAQSWSHVLDLDRRPPVARTPRGPLCSRRIAAAEGDLRELLAVLTGAHPTAARGAAMARVLLSDGTGPLRCRRARLDLDAAVREATRQASPLVGASSDGADRESVGCDQ
jgi:hypothetical protein